MLDKTTEWAFTLLRPILKKLKVQELKKKPTVVEAADYQNLIDANMGRWVIIARQSSLDDGIKGFTQIVFDKAHDLFILMIYVDKSLFANNEHELRSQRKMIAIHELVHGFAYMFMSAFLPPVYFIQIMDQSTNSRVKMTTSKQFVSMMSVIGTLSNHFATDGHFRLVGDGFMGDYAELYINLRLSYQLIVETILAIWKENEKTRKKLNISELLSLTLNRLVEEKALGESFVRERMALFLPMLYIEFSNRF